MNGPGRSPTQTHGRDSVDGHSADNASPSALIVRRVAALCFASFGVMAPWPLLAILITHTSINGWDEACLLFGGVTGIPLALLTLIGLPGTAIAPLLALLWVAAAVVPDIVLAGRLSTRRAVLSLLGMQSAFSLAQAAMGALMIFGKAA